MRILRALPLAIVCLAGCGGPSLVGKWNVSGGGAPQGATVTMTFTSNEFTQTLDATQAGMTIHADIKGTYTVTDKKIKLTTTDIKLDESKLPAQLREVVKAAVEQQKGKTEEGDLKLEGDTATITTAKGAMTLTKVK